MRSIRPSIRLERVACLPWLLVSGLLLCLCLGCAAVGRPTPTPYPTYTPRPTYTYYPTLSPIPTATPASLPPREGWERARVLHVTDGDTIDVVIGDRTFTVRYIGVDAPEINAPCYSEATQFNSYLVQSQGRIVYLERDTRETDVYDRLLRYVWLIGPDKYVMVNAELVTMGYALAKAYPPDTKYQPYLTQAQEQARQNGLTTCLITPTPSPTATPVPSPTQATATPRPRTPTSTPAPATDCPQGCVSPPPGCTIKGNINSSGVKIYHMPGQRYYEQTVIDPSRGERWFCTEQEAEANGWRKSKQ